MAIGRCVVFSIHGVLATISLVLILAGLLSPKWQEIVFQQSGDIHYHGLWQDCTYAYREDGHGDWTCTFKYFTPNQWHNRAGHLVATIDTSGHHDNASWRITVIVLISIGCLLEMMAFSLICGACCCDRANRERSVKHSAVISCVCEILAVLLVGSATIYFTRMAYEPEYRTVVEAGQTVREQQAFSVSFYLTIIGAVIGLISFFVGVGGAVMSFFGGGNGSRTIGSYMYQNHKAAPVAAKYPLETDNNVRQYGNGAYTSNNRDSYHSSMATLEANGKVNYPQHNTISV